MTSLAVGKVVRSGMRQRALTPHTDESTTNLGGQESEKATPNLPLPQMERILWLDQSRLQT